MAQKGIYLFVLLWMGKGVGDDLHVRLEQDIKSRDFVTPEYLKIILQNAGVQGLFDKQPDYFKREQLNQIVIAKKKKQKQTG